MLNSVKTQLAKFPTPAAGLALGIASLGWALQTSMPEQSGIQLTAAILSASMLLMLLAKFVLNGQLLWQELAHPVIGSVIPTSAMAAMVITVTLKQYHPALAEMIWYMALALHVIFLVVFAVNRAIRFQLQDMVPSWFVPPVGLVMAALTYPTELSRMEAGAMLYFGIACYIVMLPLMLYRLFFRANLADATLPTLAIMAAPPSLCLAGYLSFVEQPAPLLVMLLLGIAVLMTATVYLAFWRLLRLPFSPAYAAFTFPMVIGATALSKAAVYMQAFNPEVAQQLALLGQVELVIATLVVSYVALRYLMHYGKPKKPQVEPALANAQS